MYDVLFITSGSRLSGDVCSKTASLLSKFAKIDGKREPFPGLEEDEDELEDNETGLGNSGVNCLFSQLSTLAVALSVL